MKTINKTALFLGVLAIFFFTVPTVQATGASLDGIQIFPSDYVWNVPIDTLPILPNSAEMINTQNGPNGRVWPEFGYGATGSITGPVGGGYTLNVVNSSNAIYRNATTYHRSPKVLYSIPATGVAITNGKVDGTCDTNLYDCSAVVIDMDKQTMYEFAGLTGTFYADGSIKAKAAAVWPLNDYSLSTSTHGSVCAAGSSHTVGQISYEEIEKGVIPHAIQIAIPWSRYGVGNYTWPAQQANSIYVKNVSVNYPRMGERFRLNASFDASGYSRTNQIIIQAMKTYGMIVVDNGDLMPQRTYELKGFKDSRWNWNDLYKLSNIKGSDLEVVDESSLMISKTSGQARTLPVTVPPQVSTPTQSIVVTSPIGGETWTRGTSQTVKWSYTGSPGSYAKISLMKSGVVVGTIISNVSVGTSGNGSYVWPIYLSGITGNDFTVRVQSLSQPAVNGTSNNTFTVAQKPKIAVTSPNGGENWTQGTSQNVSWSYSGDPGTLVKIELLKSGVEVGTIASNASIGTGGLGTYSWQLPSTALAGNNYSVRIQSINQPAVNDTSNCTFSVANAIPSLVVTSPDGGENWTRGAAQTVTWSYTGSPGSFVKIELLKSGVVIGVINSNVTIGSGGLGSYGWQMVKYGKTGNDFTVRVQSLSQPAINDASNGNFTVSPYEA